MKPLYIAILLLPLCSCKKDKAKDIITEVLYKQDELQQPASYINEEGITIEERFLLPEGYTRITTEENSFGNYLRNLPLKPYGTEVKYYNGTTKKNYNVYCSVIDMGISDRDLQQCADAVMRLKAEYLYHQKRYDEIKFNFLSDGKPRYYTKYAKGDYSYKKFFKYMDYVFSYANTSSLSDELIAIEDLKKVKIGDVIIEKRQPYGHAVMVVDVAENKEGDKLFLLAQSYMPAQETQILLNSYDEAYSPWYLSKNNDTLETPEWTFSSIHHKRFPY